MGDEGSAYATLGVGPDADGRAIERAYKRLIKEHHPDRSGGDASRAAEINRAYRELRAHHDLTDPLELNEDWLSPGRQSTAWLLLVLLLATTALFLLFTQTPYEWRNSLFPAPRGAPAPRTVKHSPTSMDKPLNEASINEAVIEAVRLNRISDQLKLAAYSRDCHRRLRAAPTMDQLDRCAAFDDAVVQLQDRDPLRDQGPFSELAVTGRILSAAAALSDDSLATDARLDRIRVQVAIDLAPILRAGPKVSAGP